MKKRNIILTVIMAIVFTSIGFASANVEEIKAILNTKLNIKVNGQNFVAKEEDGTILTPLTYKGRTYLPVRALGEALGVPVDYDLNTKTVLLGKDEEPSDVKLNITSESYGTNWASDYIQETPILIDNLNDWKEFIEKHPVRSSIANENELQQKYNDEFFKEKIIYTYVKNETSGSITLTAKKAELNGSKLELFMERIVPEIGTSDMATRVCIFEINSDDVKDVKTVEGVISK